MKYSIVIGCIFLALMGCSADKDKTLTVVSTTGIVNDIVKNVVGNHATAIALMGPGVDPHLYKATEGDVRRLSEADLICYNGLHLEAKMGEILEQMSKRKPVISVTASIPSDSLMYPSSFEGMPDPHVWFDVLLWSNTVDEIVKEMIKLDPDHADQYQENGDTYKRKLVSLHDWIKIEVMNIPEDKRVIVTAHDAFGYFGKAYGFTVKGLQGISTESKAGTKDVIDLASYISRIKIKSIFVETSVSEKNIKAVQAAVASDGWNVTIGGELFSDALGDENTEEGTYIGMVKHNVHTIVEALK